MKWRTIRTRVADRDWDGSDGRALLEGHRRYPSLGGVIRSAGAAEWFAWAHDAWADGGSAVGFYTHRRDAKVAVELAAAGVFPLALDAAYKHPRRVWEPDARLGRNHGKANARALARQEQAMLRRARRAGGRAAVRALYEAGLVAFAEWPVARRGHVNRVRRRIAACLARADARAAAVGERSFDVTAAMEAAEIGNLLAMAMLCTPTTRPS